MLGAQVSYYLPNRFTDGYGPNIQHSTCDRRRPYAYYYGRLWVAAHRQLAMR